MTNKVNKYVNYGDVNPMEHGGIWLKRDLDTDENYPCFWVVTIQLNENEDYITRDLYVDLSSDWIEWDSVYSFAGIDVNATFEEKVIAAIEYYNPLNFGVESVCSKEDIQTFLSDRGIEVE